MRDRRTVAAVATPPSTNPTHTSMPNAPNRKPAPKTQENHPGGRACARKPAAKGRPNHIAYRGEHSRAGLIPLSLKRKSRSFVYAVTCTSQQTKSAVKRESQRPTKASVPMPIRVAARPNSWVSTTAASGQAIVHRMRSDRPPMRGSPTRNCHATTPAHASIARKIVHDITRATSESAPPSTKSAAAHATGTSTAASMIRARERITPSSRSSSRSDLKPHSVHTRPVESSSGYLHRGHEAPSPLMPIASKWREDREAQGRPAPTERLSPRAQTRPR